MSILKLKPACKDYLWGGHRLAEEYNVEFDGEILAEAEEAVMGDLRRHFRPEFLNRLDEIILFKPLTKDNITSIIDLMVGGINRRLADKELTIDLTDEAKRYITDNGYDPVYGARPLNRYLKKHVETLAARMILGGSLRAGDTILVDVKADASGLQGTVVHENQPKRLSGE